MAEIVKIEEYQALLEDRPRKFTTEQVGFEPRARQQRWRCDSCWHFYAGTVARRNVCEIVATLGERRHIPPEASCLFWTPDGSSLPRLKSPDLDTAKKAAVPAGKSHTV